MKRFRRWWQFKVHGCYMCRRLANANRSYKEVYYRVHFEAQCPQVRIYE